MQKKNRAGYLSTAFCLAAFCLIFLSGMHVQAAEETRQSGIAVDAAHFPDAVFREYVLDYLAGDDGILSLSERQDVEYLEFYYEDELSSLKGIEYFPNLQYLYCAGCQKLKSLDLRSMTNLKEVECEDNALTSLKVGGLSKLKKLICNDNNLSSLSLTKLPALTELECGQNNLTSLKVGALANLQYFVCRGNQIRALDFSGISRLVNVDCEGNVLTSLKLGNQPSLKTLSCGTNKLTSLKLSGVPALQTLYCYQNRLEGLDCTGNPGLRELEAFTNQMTVLKLDGLKNLLSINCSANRIAVLNVTAAKELTSLIADNNCLPALNLSQNKKLQQVSLTGQTASAKVTEGSDGCRVDLTAFGYKKGRISGLSSGSTYTKGIYWKKSGDIPESRIVTYTSKTGRAGITFPVTLKLTGINRQTLKPEKVKLLKAVNRKGRKISLKWKKMKGIDGYRIYCSTSSKFKKSATKTVWVKKAGTVSRVLKKLKKNKTYYVRMRAYTVYNGKKVYGSYSNKRKVKIRK